MADEGLPPGFNGLEYVASHPDLIQALGPDRFAGEEHYLRFGQAEGRAPDTFDAVHYLHNNPDVAAAVGTTGSAAARHYIEHGFAEGRTYEGPDEGGIEDEPLADAASAEWVPAGTATAPDFVL